MYTDDNNDTIPYMSVCFDTRPDGTRYPFVFDELAPYVARATGGTYSQSSVYYWTFASAPGGSYGHSHSAPAPPRPRGIAGSASAWARLRQPGSAACFYYGSRNSGEPVKPPLKAARIKKPSDALAMMDTLWYYVYSPADPAMGFDADCNGDGKLDTMSQYSPFSHGVRPSTTAGQRRVARWACRTSRLQEVVER